MMHKKRIAALLLALALLLCCAACGSSETGTESGSNDAETTYLFGVEVYDTTDPECLMYYNYLRDYIAESFPVEFILSDSVNTVEEELSFVETVKEEGGSGIIGIFTADLEQVVNACGENGMYYVIAASSSSDDEFNKVKDNPWFLGAVGPSEDEEYDAGVTMAECFLDQGAKDFLILSGGAADGLNSMHFHRVCGMLDTLADRLDLTYNEEVQELAESSEPVDVETGRDDVSIHISPGYIQMEPGRSNLQDALKAKEYDAMMSCVSIASVVDMLKEDVRSSDQPMLIGVVDCFSTENYDAVETSDGHGGSLLNFVHGKYASMCAPCFVALFNAVTENADLVNPDGEAFRLYQSFWTAENEEEFAEMYGYTQSMYVNAYSSSDMMKVIRVYNPDATYEEFVKLSEASDFDSVLERIEER